MYRMDSTEAINRIENTIQTLMEVYNCSRSDVIKMLKDHLSTIEGYSEETTHNNEDSDSKRRPR